MCFRQAATGFSKYQDISIGVDVVKVQKYKAHWLYLQEHAKTCFVHVLNYAERFLKR